jgi:hypothetical protein
MYYIERAPAGANSGFEDLVITTQRAPRDAATLG